LRAVKETEERQESHIDLTRRSGKFAVAILQGSSSRLSHLKAPTPLDRGDISGELTYFSSINGPLRAVKGTEEREESHIDLTRRSGKFAVAILQGSSSRLSHLEAPTSLDQGVIFPVTCLTFPQ